MTTFADLPPRLGPYRLERPLGQGGMGIVARAIDTRNNRPVAIKVPLLGDAPDADALARFRREAELTRGIGHPDLCPVLDVGQEGPWHYFTMPVIDGQPLSRLVGKPWEPTKAVELVRRLTGALSAVHLRGMMHRDLKPSNILVRPDGSPVVMDFGLARRLRESGRMTGTGQMLGTPFYMSPEQVNGDSEIGAATDIYSLGVILYELLTGRVPFDSPNLVALAYQIFHVTPVAPRVLVPSIPVELEAICLKVLAKQPRARFATMADLQVALESWQRRMARPAIVTPVQAEPELGAKSVTRRQAMRGRGWVLALLVALVLGLLGLGYGWIRGWGGRSTEAAQDTEPEPAKPTVGPLGMKFVRVPKGSFWMGGGDGMAGDRQVTIEADFELCLHEVTQGQWQTLMGDNPSWFSHTGAGRVAVQYINEAELREFPVENVSWDMVKEFLTRLNARERGRGYEYRLPTEAEWEYACRGGRSSREECSWDYYLGAGPTNDLSSDQANFDGDVPGGKAPRRTPLNRTAKVGSYAPNRLGLYDLHGNVWEWCADLHGAGPTRVIRGGSWGTDSRYCRAAHRFWNMPSLQHVHFGFRVARSPAKAE